MTTRGIEVRSYAFLDSLQPQYAAFLGTVAQGFLPLAGDASLFVEVAPGIDVQRDIVAQMGFRPAVEGAPRLMDERIFRPEVMGLAAEILHVRIEDRVFYDADQEILFANFENLKVDSLEQIRAFEEHVRSILRPVGKRVPVVSIMRASTSCPISSTPT